MKKLFRVAILCSALLSALGPARLANAAQNKQLEVFSWRTSGGERMALESLFHVYKYKYPGVEVLNAAVTGGGGSAARPVLQTRLAAGDPPDTWQVHPGAHRRGQEQIGRLSAVVDGVVSSRRIVGELRAWRSGPGHLSAKN